MKKLGRLIPHITLILALMTLTFFIIDRFNEFMDFMTAEMSKWLFAALAVFAIATAVRLITADLERDEEKNGKKEEKNK
ncbi:MAG: hypothetical protein E7330_06460 [Clostridiales bacterium]|nr:hypothetical protein [Clostridiales bacterium]